MEALGRAASADEARFRRRIASGFLLSTLLTALMAVAAVRSLHQLMSAKNRLLEVAEPQLLAVERAHLAALKQASAARAYLFTGDPRFYSSSRRDNAVFLSSLSRYRALDTSLESRRLVDGALHNYREYTAALAQTDELRVAGKSLGTLAIRYEARVEPERLQTEHILSALAEREIDQFQKERADSDLSAFRALFVVYGLAAALILLGLKLSQTVSGSLTVAHAQAQEASRVRGELAATQTAYRELQSLSYAISHNLRAPLRSIDAAGRRAAATPGSPESLGSIRASVTRMSGLIESLLELLGVSSATIRREPVDLTDVFKSALAEGAAKMPALRYTVAPGMTARGDLELLRLAAKKLVENAVKFTSRAAAPRIEAGVASVRGEPAFFVRDNGAGFDMAHAARLFVPFQRLHRGDEFPGLGMGLPVVARIIERHGGRIWAEGAVGGGAVFYFTLP